MLKTLVGRCLNNVMPHVEVRSRRVVDYISNSKQIQSRQKNFYGYEMVNSLFKKKKRKSMAQRLASECLAAAKKKVLLLMDSQNGG
jgi:small subunit ribosomal protein S7